MHCGLATRHLLRCSTTLHYLPCHKPNTNQAPTAPTPVLKTRTSQPPSVSANSAQGVGCSCVCFSIHAYRGSLIRLPAISPQPHLAATNPFLMLRLAQPRALVLLSKNTYCTRGPFRARLPLPGPPNLRNSPRLRDHRPRRTAP